MSLVTNQEMNQREKKVFDILGVLNKSRRQGLEGYYDCGALGIVHIYWQKQQWRWDWITISKEFRG